jgi:uncharacterized protein YcbK (DUF882 family)
MLTKHFDLREFVTPNAYIALGDKSRWLIDSRLIDIAEALRQQLQRSIVINNWHLGGKYHESGLRDMNTDTGARYSQHKYGRAMDMKVEGMEAEEVRIYIRSNFVWLNALGLTTIENNTPTWVHIDLRNTGLKTLNEIPYA